jgi:gluconokinase
LVVQGGALSDGGNVFAWLIHTLRLDPSPELDRDLLAMPPDAHGLTVLPFLAGERSPYWNLNARAGVFGMTLDTEPIEIARAALEAVAYRFGLIYISLKHTTTELQGIIGSGAGLLNSPAWMQIMTDVLGEPMAVSAVPEASSRGAALLALQAMGALSDLSSTPAPLGATYLPNQHNNRTYRTAMERQQELYRRVIAEPDERAVESTLA